MRATIRADFDIRDIARSMYDGADAICDAAVEALSDLGRRCVDYARTNNGFDDETGNLVSSIGYKVFRDGRCVDEDYVQYLEGSEGMMKGELLADMVGRRCGNGEMMLVVTAGEEYAIFLEANGHDVLTSSEMLAVSEWPRMKRRIDAMIRRVA